MEVKPAPRFFGEWTDKDSGGVVALAINEVYKVGSDGFVTAYDSTQQSNSDTSILTDGNNPPTTKRVMNFCGADGRHGATCPVRKDDFFKVTGTATNIYWLPYGFGACVKQV